MKAKQFILALLRVNQNVRLTAAEALKHPWLQGNGEAANDGGNLCHSMVRSVPAPTQTEESAMFVNWRTWYGPLWTLTRQISLLIVRLAKVFYQGLGLVGGIYE